MNFQNSGGVLCFLPKVEKGKEEQREGGRRKGENASDVFRRCMEIGMFIPNAFAGFPVNTQKSLSMCTEREVRKKSAPDRTRTYTSRDTRS